jgi:hypothetical protein
MIHLYNFIPDFSLIRERCTIDLSKLPAERLADECDRILQHHKTCVLFLGFLEAGWMLDPRHEARIRLAIRKFESHIVCFHLESLPHSWKNEIDTVYVKSSKDGSSKAIDDGCAVHTQSETTD